MAKRKIKSFLILPIIIIITGVLRFTTAAKLAPFTPDEEYLIYLANTIIKDFHIIWIGVSSLGFDLYMGPFWIYLIVPFLKISNGDPIILNYLSSAFGIGTVVLLYIFGERLFSKKIAIIASLIYALSPLIIFYDQKAYPTGISLLALLLAYSIYMTKHSKWWWISFSILYGLVFHLHLSLILTIFVAAYWAFTHRKTLSLKIIILSVLAFIVTISPLIVFDYFHKGSNIKTPIRVITAIIEGKSVKINLYPRYKTFFESLGRVFYLPAKTEASNEILPSCPKSRAPTILSILILTIVLIFFIQKQTWKEEKRRLIASFSLCFIVPFLFLPIINPVEYYLLGFFPFLFLIVSKTLEKFTFPLLILAVLAIITITTAKGSFGITAQKNAILEVMNKINGGSFDLSEDGNCHKYSGWRYLFKAYGQTPARSSEDYNFSWLYPDEVSKEKVEYSVIMIENASGFSANILKH